MSGKLPAKAETTPGEELEILPSEQPQQQAEATIELDAQTGKPIQTAVEQSSYSAEEIKKIQARMEYQARQNERLTKQLEEATRAIQGLQAKPTPARTAEKPEGEFDEDLHAIAQANYQRAIAIQAERVAEKKFNALMEKREAEQREQTEKQRRMQTLEASKAKVLSKLPALSDENSDEFRNYYSVYSQMMNEDPDLLQNPRAPEIVYAEMRDRLSSSSKPADEESARLRRVVGTSTPQGRPVSSSKTIKLTQAEIDMCKEKGLSPAVYAQMKEANFKEGVSA